MAKFDGAERLAKQTAEARERIAAELFEPKKVLAALSKQAGKGLDVAEIIPDVPVSLDRTEAAERLVAVLTKHGIKSSWVVRSALPDDPKNPKKEKIDYRILQIRWPL